MSPRARDKYGINVGPEVKWKGRQPERPKRPKAARRWRPRRTIQNPPRPKPTTCAQVSCPYLKAPVIPGRVVCEGCAEKLDARAAELRKREEKRTARKQSAAATADTARRHDREVSPDG